MLEGHENYFCGKENAITAKKLQEGQDCVVVGIGNSMAPILKSKQACFVEALKEDTFLEKGDIVFCKVNGYYYLHKIWAVKNNSYLIGNNHGHANGTVSRKSIFGKVTKIL